MNATHDRAKSIFLTAAEIASAEERRAFVEAQCAGDESLRGEVDELLRHQQSLGSFLEQPAVAGDATVYLDPPISERPGSVIGPYKLLQQIGEGGMGVVFMAEQTEPIQRTVALKIIKPGMDTRQVIARFEAERQALALMDHPNIARVLDAGTTGAGDWGLGASALSGFDFGVEGLEFSSRVLDLELPVHAALPIVGVRGPRFRFLPQVCDRRESTTVDALAGH